MPIGLFPKVLPHAREVPPLVVYLPSCSASPSSRPSRLPCRPAHDAGSRGRAAAPASDPAPGRASVSSLAGPPAEACLATTLCALKDEVRWRTPAWSPSQCQLIADAVQSAAEQHELSPALILAVMLNESDLDDKAVSSYERDGAVYAKDGGLMGIRCVFDQRGRCKNGFVKGMTFKNIMDPFTNIALGARELAYYRNGGGVEKRVVRVRGADGSRGKDQERALPPRHPRLLAPGGPVWVACRQRTFLVFSSIWPSAPRTRTSRFSAPPPLR